MNAMPGITGVWEIGSVAVTAANQGEHESVVSH